ncbi:MAG: DUF342 domain-containing protein [Candidatus Glassbacteria bacterium]|nr:DUF342 domain-containing protein [Candidatus Glassbacteria bacterium]
MAKRWKKIDVHLRRNKTRAYLRVPYRTPEGTLKEPLKIEDALKALKAAGVVEGIDYGRLKMIFEQNLFDEEMLVARGNEPRKGSDARIEYYINTENKSRPVATQQGQVDYKKASLINNVSSGDRLCRRHPPGEGRPGKTVTGRKIPAEPGEDIPLPQGVNTKPYPDDPDILLAEIDGHAVLNGKNLVEVRPFLEVKGNVDYSTGNIDFKGSVRIRGDIKSGFKVRAAGELEVDGCVEDAEVEAAGDITVKKGFIGRGNGHIRAGGNLAVGHVKNQKITCSGYLNAGGEILHARVYAGKDIFVYGKNGAVIGGVVEAGGSIDAARLGNDQFVKTGLFAGSKAKTRDRLEKVEKAIAKLEENQTVMQDTLQKLFKLRAEKEDDLPAEKQSLLKKVQRTRLHHLKRHKELSEEKKRILEEIGHEDRCHIKAIKSVFPGVEMTIGRARRKISRRYDKKIFRCQNGKVVAGELFSSQNQEGRDHA